MLLCQGNLIFILTAEYAGISSFPQNKAEHFRPSKQLSRVDAPFTTKHIPKHKDTPMISPLLKKRVWFYIDIDKANTIKDLSITSGAPMSEIARRLLTKGLESPK